jgi:hypothetical protein
VGLNAFSWKLQFDDFTRSGTGFGTTLTYPVTALGYTELWGLPLEEVRVGSDYRIESAEINGLGLNATRSIRAEEGKSLISSVTPRVTRNTLNHFFDPTAGSFQDLSLEVAGLGGERFMKAEARERWYKTFWRSKLLGDFTYSFGGTLGYGFRARSGVNGDELPSSSATPGGISSIRAETHFGCARRAGHLRRVISTTPVGGSEGSSTTGIFPPQSIGLRASSCRRRQRLARRRPARRDAAPPRRGVRWLSPIGAPASSSRSRSTPSPRSEEPSCSDSRLPVLDMPLRNCRK